MTCLTCKHLDSMDKKMAEVGYGHCAYSPVGSFNSIRHAQCEKFESVDSVNVAKRIAWANSREGTR